MSDGKQREWLTVAEFLRRNPHLGKNLVYQQIHEGTLLAIRVGGKILMASDALDLLAESKARAASAQ